MTNLTTQPKYAMGLRRGDVLILKEDCFLCVMDQTYISPQNHGRLPFSVNVWRNHRNSISDYFVRYVQDVVPAGTRMEFERINGRKEIVGGMEVHYYAKIISGRLQGSRAVCIDDVLFPENRAYGISGRYLENVSNPPANPLRSAPAKTMSDQ